MELNMPEKETREVVQLYILPSLLEQFTEETEMQGLRRGRVVEGLMRYWLERQE